MSLSLYQINLESEKFNINNLYEEIRKKGSAHTAIVAGSDTGKNILLFYLLSKISKLFDYIHVLTGTSPKQYLNIAFSNRIQVVKETSNKSSGKDTVSLYLSLLKEKIENNSSKSKHLVIIDDLSKNALHGISADLNIIRHYKVSMFVITQQIINIPHESRHNFKFWFVKNKAGLGPTINSGSGHLNWTVPFLKKIEPTLNNLKNTETYLNLWISVDSDNVKILQIDSNFFNDNFSKEDDDKFYYNKQHLKHQIFPKKILFEINQKKNLKNGSDKN